MNYSVEAAASRTESEAAANREKKKLIEKLDRYVTNGTKVTLQVKDLEPTTGTRHIDEPETFITGTLSKYMSDFGFREDGRRGGQFILKSSLNKIKEVVQTGGIRKKSRKTKKSKKSKKTKKSRRHH
jgi:hypothetical protein